MFTTVEICEIFAQIYVTTLSETADCADSIEIDSGFKFAPLLPVFDLSSHLTLDNCPTKTCQPANHLIPTFQPDVCQLLF